VEACRHNCLFLALWPWISVFIHCLLIESCGLTCPFFLDSWLVSCIAAQVAWISPIIGSSLNVPMLSGGYSDLGTDLQLFAGWLWISCVIHSFLISLWNCS
jgi:hypothetical protein